MKRIFKWIGRQLAAQLRKELEGLAAQQKRQADEAHRASAQIAQLSETLAAQQKRQADEARRAGAQIAQLSETLAVMRARIEAALADAVRARELAKQEAAARKRDLAGIKDATKIYLDHAAKMNAQELSWSKDTTKMIADLRAEMPLFLGDLAGIKDATKNYLEHAAKMNAQELSWSKDTAKMVGDLRAEMPLFLRDLAGIKDVTKNYLDHATKMNAQELSWSKDTAKMIGDLRAEVRLFLQEPTFASTGAEDESGDPKLLRRYVEGSNIREIFPTELFLGLERESLPIASINERSDHANQVDLMYVGAIAKVRRARNIFEFGTYVGRTTYHLSFASEEAHVTTLDLPSEAQKSAGELGHMFRGTDREGRITQLLVDSASFDAAPYAGSMDFIFIDADHSYELVKNDTEKALIMLRPGGVIVWHDYAVKSPGVVRYIQEFASTRPVFRLRHTCLIVYVDGVDAMAFEPGQRLPQVDWPEVVPLHRASARRGRGEG